MPSKSKSQRRLMTAVAHGWKPDRVDAPPKKVAREFMREDQKQKKFLGGPVSNALTQLRESNPDMDPERMERLRSFANADLSHPEGIPPSAFRRALMGVQQKILDRFESGELGTPTIEAPGQGGIARPTVPGVPWGDAPDYQPPAQRIMQPPAAAPAYPAYGPSASDPGQYAERAARHQARIRGIFRGGEQGFQMGGLARATGSVDPLMVRAMMDRRSAPGAMLRPPMKQLGGPRGTTGPGYGGGEGMMGVNPGAPPSLRGYLQKMRMMQREPNRQNRVGTRDQQGALARALQRGTGRPPISRRMAFPGTR